MKLETGGFVASSFRTLAPFRLVRATRLIDAVEAVSIAMQADEAAAVLAGGTDLPARFNEGFAPTLVVDISGIDDLRRIEHRDGALVIGAAVTHAAGSTHPLIREHLPSFGQAWSRIANVRIRMSATLGGNLMARRTRYEAAILLAALGANVRFATANGVIEATAEDCFDAPAGALLTAILIPLRKGLRLDYERSMRPIMTQAVAIDAAGNGRLVTATEFVRPRVQLMEGAAVVPSSTPETAFGDPVTSDGYLRRMRTVFLARQIARMRSAA